MRNRFLTLAAALCGMALMALAGCDFGSQDEKPTVLTAPKGTVRVVIDNGESAQDNSRTAVPASTSFTYTLTFSAEGKPDVTASLGRNTTGEVSIDAGTWALSVIGQYSGAMVAEADPITVTVPSDGDAISVSVTVHPVLNGSNGTFSYRISASGGLTGVSAVLTPLDVGSTGQSERTLSITSYSQTASVAPGYYRLKVTARKGIQTLIRRELVHIYSYTTTQKTYELSEADFAPAVYLAGTLTGSIEGYSPLEVIAYEDADGSTNIGQSAVSGGAWNMDVERASETLYFKVKLAKGGSAGAYYSKPVLVNGISAVGNMDMVLPIEAYTITFDASGGGFEDGGTTITMTAPENETLTPPSVSHSEYAFTEWYSTDNKSFTAETSIKGDTTVYARWLVSIAVTSLPTKTAYFVGEVLDLNGLVVTGIYANNTTKTEIVSMDNISGYNADTTGQQTLTVTVNSKTATFSVTVHAITLVSIAITSPPIKTTYLTGEDLNLSGLEVTGTYTNNTTKTEVVSMDNVSGYDTNNEGQQTLIVTVDGKTASFTVTVNPASFTVYYYDDTVQAMNVYYWTDAGGGNLSMTDIGDGWFSAVVPSSIGMRFNDNYQQTVDLTRTHTGYFLPERTDIFGKIIGTWYGTKPSTEPGNQSYYYPGTGKTYAGFQGTKGKLATSYDEVTVTFPMETSFSADAFFTLEGRVKNPGSYNYALVKVEKNDNPDLTTSYWVRGVFKTRIWLRFGSGDYTVTVTRVSEVTAVGSPDGNPNGGAILGWRYYTSGNITFTVTNTQSGDGDARWIYPSAVVQSDDPLVTQTASTITAGLVSDRDKARAVHDYLVQNTVYDMVDYLDHSKHRKQDAVTVLETRYQEDSQYPGGHFLAVCEGYANTAAALLRAVGVKMKYIESTPMSHAWNNVYIGGYWKFMDVTWDDSVPDQGPTYTRYTYFLLDSLSGVNYDHYDYYDGTRVVRPAIPTQRGMPDGWY